MPATPRPPSRQGPSVLLVEVLGGERFSESKAAPFPFIAGFLAARGIACRWVGLVRRVPPGGDALVFDPDAAGRRAILAEAASQGATHLLFSEAPSPSWRRALERRGLEAAHCAVPGGAFEARWLADWLGLGGPCDGFLPDLAEPVYRARVLGPPPEAPPLTPLVAGPSCLYAAPLSGNPAYRGVDLAGARRDFGCAFCPGPADLRYAWRTPPLDLATRQIKAVQAEERALWSRSEFSVASAPLLRRMGALLARLEREGVGPAALHFNCRADEASARAQDIESALRVAQRRGHTIHISSMGAENFSPAENRRFNKGLSAARLRRALALMRGWERRFPKTFFFTRHGGLGFILFTPWTTLADLRLNLGAARSLGLEEASFFLTRRAMLLEDAPLTLLARRDGLVDPKDREARRVFAWLKARCDPGCRRFPGERDIPWRFRDPLAGAVCALATRLALREAAPADPLHRAVLAAARQAGLESRLLDAFEHLLDAAEAHAGPPTAAALLRTFLARLASSPDARVSRVCFPVFARAEGLLEGYRLTAARPGRGSLELSLRGREDGFQAVARPGRGGAWRLSCRRSAGGPARREKALAAAARLLKAIGPARLGLEARSKP